jgi:hypothetical protein
LLNLQPQQQKLQQEKKKMAHSSTVVLLARLLAATHVARMYHSTQQSTKQAEAASPQPSQGRVSWSAAATAAGASASLSLVHQVWQHVLQTNQQVSKTAVTVTLHDETVANKLLLLLLPTAALLLHKLTCLRP